MEEATGGDFWKKSEYADQEFLEPAPTTETLKFVEAGARIHASRRLRRPRPPA
jgi:hypothetical protein